MSPVQIALYLDLEKRMPILVRRWPVTRALGFTFAVVPSPVVNPPRPGR